MNVWTLAIDKILFVNWLDIHNSFAVAVCKKIQSSVAKPFMCSTFIPCSIHALPIKLLQWQQLQMLIEVFCCLKCSYAIWTYCRAPFFNGYKFCEQRKKGNSWKLFHEMTLAELFIIQVNLCTIEFVLIFSEINFVEFSKICKIHKKFCAYIRLAFTGLITLSYTQLRT